MIRQALPKTVWTVTCVLTLTACGGGGGGSDTPTPAPANRSPAASFTATPTEGTVPLSVDFDASGSSDADGRIASYAWTFGEPPGASSTSGVNTSHTYEEAGTYTVELTVTDDDGATGSTTRTVTVEGPVASISGTVRILASSAIDSDVNDFGSTPAPNNDFASAQPLPNPVTLGGFANVAGVGVGDEPERGKLFQDGDPGDFYAMTMVGNEFIYLNIADPENAEQELLLYDSQQNVISADGGPGEVQVAEVPAAGDYFIEVRPIAGASNYVLTVGQDLVPERATTMIDPFLPREIILRTTDDEIAAEYGLSMLAQSGPRMLLKAGPATAALRHIDRRAPFDASWTEDQQDRYATLAVIEALGRDPRVELAEPNLIRKPHREPGDSFYRSQWHYQAINLPLAWDITTGDGDVIVAVVDTGIRADHPDLDEKVIAGFDFIANLQRAADGDARDDDPTDPGDGAFGGSSSFHGTHVAGTVAAETSASVTPASGVAGVAWEAKIMPLRVLGVGGGTSFDVIESMRWAARLDNVSGTLPDRAADVINLSLGGGGFLESEQQAIDEIRAAGTIIVASAGNDASASPSYPAAYDGVVSVSATTIENNPAAYSNFGTTVDVAAPGGSNVTDVNGDGIGDGVISTMADDSDPSSLRFGYASLQGTSMAAPHVAGVVALMKAVHPGLTPIQFDNALASGRITDDLGAPGRDDRYGWGLINAQKAVLAALDLASNPPGPTLAVSASSLTFGAALSSQSLRLENVGSGTVTVQSIGTAASWLDVAPSSVLPGGMGSYTVTVDRTGLTPGSYTGAIEIVTDAVNPTATVTATMRVFTTSPDANAGVHYVVLVDAAGETLPSPQNVLEATNGEYAYRLDGVAPGDYRIFAGTDSDDDAFLCDAGEACGTYGTLDSPAVVTVDGEDLTGIDFTSEFRVNLTNLSANADVSGQVAPEAVRLPGKADGGAPR
jgi:serine protease